MPHSSQPYGFQSSVLDHVSSTLAFWDTDLRCRYANRAYEQWFGVTPERLIGQSIRDLLGPTLFALNEPYIRKALGGTAQTFERIVPGPDGVLRHSLARYTPDVVGGQVVGFIAEVTDVTPLKETQAALLAEITAHRRVNELLQKKDVELELAQRLGQLGSWHWEIAADITTWSQELYRIFGRDPRRLPPSYAEHPALYTPRSWHRLQAAVARACNDGSSYQLELQFHRPDGTLGTLDARGSVERDDQGVVVGLRGTAQDVTERNRMLAQVRSQHERVRLATQAARLGIWRWRLSDDQIVWENHLAPEILGVESDARSINVHALISEFIHPEDASAFRAALEGTVDQGQDLRITCRVSWQGGHRLRWIEFLGQPDQSDPAKPAIVGTMADVTDRIAVQMTLEHVVSELSSLDQRKSEFLNVLGHELRNCLAPLSTGIAVIRRTSSKDVLSRMYDLLNRQVTHMSRLVDDLFDLRRVQSGELSLKREVTTLAKVMASAVDMSLPAITNEGHDLEVDLGATDVYLDCDPIRLAQVFSNLLNNAAKFSAQGQIRVTAALSAEVVEIAVSDDGIGMTSDEVQSIFGLYSQAGFPGARRSAGLGVGLHLVKRLVELHGGAVSVYSAGLGNGSTFTVTLPIKRT